MGLLTFDTKNNLNKILVRKCITTRLGSQPDCFDGHIKLLVFRQHFLKVRKGFHHRPLICLQEFETENNRGCIRIKI